MVAVSVGVTMMSCSGSDDECALIVVTVMSVVRVMISVVMSAVLVFR